MCHHGEWGTMAIIHARTTRIAQFRIVNGLVYCGISLRPVLVVDKLSLLSNVGELVGWIFFAINATSLAAIQGALPASAGQLFAVAALVALLGTIVCFAVTAETTGLDRATVSLFGLVPFLAFFFFDVQTLRILDNVNKDPNSQVGYTACACLSPSAPVAVERV